MVVSEEEVSGMGKLPEGRTPNKKTLADRFYRLAALATRKFEKRFDGIDHIDNRQHPIKYVISVAIKFSAKIVGVTVATYHFFELFRIHL